MSSDQPPKQPTRQERQAAALRENLRKRKEQARERRQPDPPPALTARARHTTDPTDSPADPDGLRTEDEDHPVPPTAASRCEDGR